MRVLTSLVVLVLSVAGPASPAHSDEVDADAAVALLEGKTWNGTNDQGQEFWFFHDPKGKFRAKFEPGINGQSLFSGEWGPKDSDVCWAWEDWETFCYYNFQREGPELTMTSTEQIPYSGVLVPGSPEGL